ncbi:probable pectinesterase/pectinesterase inhibitor 59 [Humulus lupulus]|uniref:probable pectinesterase/pectinesterase inhibitor 59 n=1 Tax=Humulus lupulus TaxID=3486 RepID=UPI002B40C287|nr:probable pectinesterase/pectinesterase inhibitor 59 [Humulus lupulus]
MTLRNVILVVVICLVLIFSLIFPTVLSIRSQQSSSLTQWCDETPHPGPCKFYMSHGHHRFGQPKQPSDFRKILVQVAIERALEARRHAFQLGPNCESKPQKSAWADCLKLYDDTVFQLNRTLQGLDTKKRSCTDFDAQTWLSTALTNIDTCLAGSLELNVTDFIMPIASNYNVSESISNGLAINAGLVDKKESEVSTDEDFPSWVSETERRRLLKASPSSIKVNLVVAKDGSGHFRSVQAAINAAARRRIHNRFVIRVKKGIYRENIEVGINNDNIMLMGDGLRKTIITSSRSVKAGYTTYSSATAGIDGLRFIARGITFQNTAGPQKGQAVALRSASDLSVFYRCAFQGYQDTLMVHSQRQFYKECYIYGTIDFIFGNAAVVFQNCIIYVRRPLKGQVNVITAQGRNDPYQSTAISIHNSQVRAAPDLLPVVGGFKTFLGRPWKQYSRTIFLKCFLDNLVSPAGWLEWNRTPFALKTLYYGEYKNFGPASSTRRRVRWPGFHVITSAKVASQFTPGSLISGKSWLPSTGVPFKLGL